MGRLKDMIIGQKRVEGDFSLEEILSDLKVLLHLFQETEKRMKKGWRNFFLLAVVAFILFMLGIFLYLPLLILGIAALVAAVVILIRSQKQYKRNHLMADFKTTLLPFLEEMAEDFDPKRPLHLALDLRGPVKEKLKREWESDEETFHFALYRDPWLRLRARLRDGNILELSCENTWIKRLRHWKKKVKWKKKALVKAAIVAKNSGLAWQEDEIRGDMIFQPSKKRGRLMLMKKFKYKALANPPMQGPPAQEVLAMFMEIYRCSMPEEGRNHG